MKTVVGQLGPGFICECQEQYRECEGSINRKMSDGRGEIVCAWLRNEEVLTLEKKQIKMND
jgi:hypothetical protein